MALADGRAAEVKQTNLRLRAFNLVQQIERIRLGRFPKLLFSELASAARGSRPQTSTARTMLRSTRLRKAEKLNI
jgi:hypothetical protein